MLYNENIYYDINLFESYFIEYFTYTMTTSIMVGGKPYWCKRVPEAAWRWPTEYVDIDTACVLAWSIL